MTDDNDDILKLIEQAESLLKRVKFLLDGESTGFPEDLWESVKKRVCLGCGKKIPRDVRVFRGNHESCYRRVYRKIQDGRISNSEAVGAGLLTPSSPGGKTQKSTHLDEYLAVREQTAEFERNELRKKSKGKKSKTKKGTARSRKDG